MLALVFLLLLAALLALCRAALPPSLHSGDPELAKHLPAPLLELLRPVIASARGAYGLPGEPGSMVDEAQWQPAADPANPFPCSIQL
jgi:hypothetical protein